MEEILEYLLTVPTKSTENTGIRKIAITKKPAIEVKGVALESEEEGVKKVFFSDEKKMQIAAPLMIPNKRIYRAAKGEEPAYYTVMSEETVEEIHNELMANPERLAGIFNDSHQEGTQPKAFVAEIWLTTEPGEDKSKKYGIEVPKGSSFVVAQFTDKNDFELYAGAGKTGFSIEGDLAHIIKEVQHQEERKNYSDVILIDNAGCALILMRKKDDDFEPEKWGFPGGKIEAGESPEIAAIRELTEETGIKVNSLTEVEVMDNEDGTKTHYYTMNYPTDQQVVISSEHENFAFKKIQEIENLPVICDQNKRFSYIVDKSINLNSKKMPQLKEGDELEIEGVKYTIKDGKPVLLKSEEMQEPTTDGATPTTTPTEENGVTKEVKKMIEDLRAEMDKKLSEQMEAIVKKVIPEGGEGGEGVKREEMEAQEKSPFSAIYEKMK